MWDIYNHHYTEKHPHHHNLSFVGNDFHHYYNHFTENHPRHHQRHLLNARQSVVHRSSSSSNPSPQSLKKTEWEPLKEVSINFLSRTPPPTTHQHIDKQSSLSHTLGIGTKQSTLQMVLKAENSEKLNFQIHLYCFSLSLSSNILLWTMYYQFNQLIVPRSQQKKRGTVIYSKSRISWIE